ncbi:MAG: aquaporin [Oligoflexia bacterium]|nr:aquaporin [Oligoflexia bacterium]
MELSKFHDFFGEMIGTAIIVLFGCGTVAVSVLFNSDLSLMEVALLWGITVSLAIYATRYLSCAHLNPAVSLGLVVAGRMSIRKIPTYLTAQFIGGFLAAFILYFLFKDSIALYENIHHIVRGSAESIKTAMMFGEFYPNPGAGDAASVTFIVAFFAEFLGTAFFMFFIMMLTHDCNIGGPGDSLTPLCIGFAIAVNIVLVASLTQAGFNPARDFSPRMVAYLMGWGDAALAGGSFLSSIVVYVFGPIAGASTTAILFRFFIDKMMLDKSGGLLSSSSNTNKNTKCACK